MFDTNGKRIGTEAYDDMRVYDFDAEWAVVRKAKEWGIVDKTLSEQVRLIHDDIQLLSPEWLAQENGREWRFLNRKLEYIVEQSFWRYKVLSPSKVSVANINTGVLHLDKGLLLPQDYQLILDMGNDFLIVDKGDQVWQTYDCKSQEWSEEVFDFVFPWELGTDCIWAKKDGLWGLYNGITNWLVTPRYYRPMELSKGIIRVENKEAKQGVVNEKGEEIIPLIYDGTVQHNHLFKVKKGNNEWYYINDKNQKLSCVFLK